MMQNPVAANQTIAPPTKPVNASHHEALALRAVALTTFASRLPWEASRRLGQPAHVPYYLNGVVDPSTGRTDPEKLATLIAGR